MSNALIKSVDRNSMVGLLSSAEETLLAVAPARADERHSLVKPCLVTEVSASA
jgi:hypothetical protein